MDGVPGTPDAQDVEQVAEEVQKATAEEARQEAGDPSEHTPAENEDHKSQFGSWRYLHVGPGAEGCEDVDEETGVSTCGNPHHFHAYLRLPNPIQHDSIREKAMAAKARRMRLLRDPESDPRVVLDAELEEMVRQDDREALINEVVGSDYVKDYYRALQEVREDEKYETVDEDRERFRALSARPEEERPAEEYKELEQHLEQYVADVRKALEEIQRPLRESLADKPIEELVELVREDRINKEAHQAFDLNYSQWEWFIGTMKLLRDGETGLPRIRMWSDFAEMQGAPGEVIEALEQAFTEMDAEVGRALKGS